MLCMKDLGSCKAGAEITTCLVWENPARQLAWGETGSAVRFSLVIATGKSGLTRMYILLYIPSAERVKQR